MERTSGNNIKAIVFDWDGVIVDSMPMIARLVQATAASYGVHITEEKILSTYFQPKEAFYKSIGVDTSNLAELNARHYANDEKYLYNANPPLFRDALATLEQLAETNARLGVVTGRTQENIRHEVLTHGFQKFFPSVHVLGGKTPKEKNLLTMGRKMGFLPAELLYIDDLPSGITAAKKAGAKSAAIARHESGKARLKALKPDYFLNSLLDLLAIL